MHNTDYVKLITERQRFWGQEGPWRGEVGNFEFTTKAGLKAAVRRDADSGHLYGCVAIQNPDHPALTHDWIVGAARVGSFERPVNRIPETSPQILDLPMLFQGSWFIFSCGYETFGDRIPRWGNRPGTTYRDTVYVQMRCEELASTFDEMWNKKVRELAQKQIADAFGKAHFLPDRSVIRGVNVPAPKPDSLWAGYAKSMGNLGAVAKPKVASCPFKISKWRTDTSTVKHEIETIDTNTVHVKVLGRNNKVLVEFDISKVP